MQSPGCFLTNTAEAKFAQNMFQYPCEGHCQPVLVSDGTETTHTGK